ncbi:hypothetical protein CLU95_0154 [Variovorax sp. 54]|uniref:hypothetical protein n=1 Tax=Variovorax sp. 54 TaxID=2035212 RepID=UPI000C18E398|nr:hypothetical protein [Variovorax sp. 54]PIF73070.1 hypothetical protein CLU95_0154 [Variovorax sp. 54]
MSLRDIHERYGVSFERGTRVICGGRLGTVAGASNSHIRIKFDGRQISSPCDPLEVQPCHDGATGPTGLVDLAPQAAAQDWHAPA